MSSEMSPTYCTGCGNEIDPKTCHCGDEEFCHGYDFGHSFVPMGCDCLRDGFEPDKTKVIFALRIEWRKAVEENERLRSQLTSVARCSELLDLLRRVRQIAIEGFYESEWREIHRDIHRALQNNLNEDQYIEPITER